MLTKLLTGRPRTPQPPAAVRLLPAVMATLTALLGVKAVAMAEDIADVAPSEHAAPATAEPTAAPLAAEAAAACAAPTFAEMAGLSQSEVQVLQALGTRRQTLDQRATQLETQDELMSAAERRLDERVAELRQLETTVNVLLGQLDEAQERRLTSLVDVYQRMRAKDAATVFDGLGDDVLVQVASRMRQQNLAEVMGRMEPTRARRLTQMLAELSRPPADGADLLSRARSGPAAPASAAAAPAAAPAAGR